MSAFLGDGPLERQFLRAPALPPRVSLDAPLRAMVRGRVGGALEDLVGGLKLLDPQRDLVGDADAVAF